jgi:hypothetical protein
MRWLIGLDLPNLEKGKEVIKVRVMKQVNE